MKKLWNTHPRKTHENPGSPGSNWEPFCKTWTFRKFLRLSRRPFFFPPFSQRHTTYKEKTLEYPIGKSALSNPHHLCNSFLTWITWHLKQLQKIVEFQSLQKKSNFILNWGAEGGQGNKRNHYHQFFWWVTAKVASRDSSLVKLMDVHRVGKFCPSHPFCPVKFQRR